MTFDDIIKNRRSIRHFKPDPLTKEQILAILEAGN
ncbi:MAG: nitroreductase family protein, partial [Candidatus Heimdallarchaeota archaeon]